MSCYFAYPRIVRLALLLYSSTLTGMQVCQKTYLGIGAAFFLGGHEYER